MGKPIELNQSEEALRKELHSICADVWRLFEDKSSTFDRKQFNKLYTTMAQKAHQLHMSLKNRGIEVKHHNYMLKNRGCNPESIDFYEHIHPVEDLLDFIDDDDANNDPVDQTIGEKFELNIYTRRWGHKDCYQIERTESGWRISILSFSGDCTKDGYPVLYSALDHDGVCYPKQTNIFLEWLWDKAHEDGLSKEEVQEALNEIGQWISNCEKKAPRGVFGGLI